VRRWRKLIVQVVVKLLLRILNPGSGPTHEISHSRLSDRAIVTRPVYPDEQQRELSHLCQVAHQVTKRISSGVVQPNDRARLVELADAIEAGPAATPHPRRQPRQSDERDDDEQPRALPRNAEHVMRAMAGLDVHLVATAEQIGEAMDPAVRRSTRRINEIVGALIEHQLAERPHGSRSGSRLTTSGRLAVSKLGKPPKIS